MFFDALNELEKNECLTYRNRLAIQSYYNQLNKAGQNAIEGIWYNSKNIQNILNLIPLVIYHHTNEFIENNVLSYREV